MKNNYTNSTSEDQSLSAPVALHSCPEPLEGSSTLAGSRSLLERHLPTRPEPSSPGHHAKGCFAKLWLLGLFLSFQRSLPLSLSLPYPTLLFSLPPSLPPSVKIIHSDEVAPQPENESSNEKVRQANNNKERNWEKGERGLVRGKDLRTRKGQMFCKYMQSKTGCTLNTSTEKQTNHCALPPATLVGALH